VKKALIGLLLLGQAVAQRRTFTHLSVEEGLSQNSVMQIAQDHKGFLWFGTHYGLNRYDGVRFKVYRNDPADSNSLSDNYINALLADSRGYLWVGTSRLDRYDPVKNVFCHIAALPINCLLEDKRGNIWVGTSRGLDFIQAGQLKISRVYVFPGSQYGDGENSIHALYEDAAGDLWVGTGAGLVCMTPAADGVYNTRFIHEGLKDTYITSLTGDGRDRLWIGTQHGGVYVHDASGFTPLPAGSINNNIRKVLFDRAGRLWIGTQEGLVSYDTARRVFDAFQHDPADKQSLSQNSIYSIFQDTGGSFWVGTYFGGVNVSYAASTPFMVYQSNKSTASIDNNVVSGIDGDEHHLWMGTEGGGVNELDRETGRFHFYKNIPGDPGSLGSNLVKVVYRDRLGRVWVGTHGGGLDLYDPVRHGFKRFLYTPNDPVTLNSEINSLLLDSSGLLWVGTRNGLRFLRGADVTSLPGPALPASLRGNQVRALLEDSRKAVWIGAFNGLFCFAGGVCRPVFAGSVNCLHEDVHGDIWVGTYFGGLSVFHRATGQWTTYTRKDGLPNDNVTGILEDKQGNLWISTGNGLSRYPGFRTYTRTDGLAANEFNYNSYYKSSDGELFFGGYNGVTAFYPDRIETNRASAPLVFTGLRVLDGFEDDIAYTGGITLRARQNVFTVDFALLNFIKSDKNKYAYMLAGFEQGWHYTAQPSASYMNLPAGDYRLLVKGANNDGVWGSPVSLSISVLPPWWRTWWAWSAYVLLFAAVLFLVIRYFWIRALLVRDQALHQAKLNFFTNISHEIRTRLTLIAGPLEKVLLSDSLAVAQLTHVKNNADRLLQLVEELMDFRKAETHHLRLHVAPLNIVAFAREVFSSFGDLAASRSVQFDFIATVEDVPCYLDPVQMEKVLYNLLSNAFKFTPDGGFVSVAVSERAGWVCLSVADNGRGIASEHLQNLFVNFFQVDDKVAGYGIGLALSRSIVQLHRGRLEVESEPGVRTCFTVLLRTGFRHFTKEQLVTRSFDAPVRTILPSLAVSSPIVRSGRSATLLLVEDNPEVRAFILQSLPAEYRVLECADGAAGWATACLEIPDVIISDVMMPSIDGLTLCGMLKSDPRTNHIPVILLTARASPIHHVDGLEKGADVYLTKPFSVQVLLLHIRNLLASVETMRRKYGLQFSQSAPQPIPNDFLRELVLLIEEHLESEDFDIPLLCTKVAMSQSVLYKKVKAVTGLSVGDFIRQVRFRKAASLLEEGQLSVYEVAYAVGFSDSKYFSREFKKVFGKTPSAYGKAGSDLGGA